MKYSQKVLRNAHSGLRKAHRNFTLNFEQIKLILTKTILYKCHRHENWVKEKTERFECICSIQGSGMDTGRCADKW